MPDGPARLVLVSAGPIVPRRSARPRRWWGAAGVSLVLHGAVLAALLLGMARQRGLLQAVDQPATVQLVMSPPGNADRDTPATAPPQPDTAKRQAEQAPAKPAPATQPAKPAPAPAPQPAQPALQPAPPSKAVQSDAPPKPATPPPMPPAATTAQASPPVPAPPTVADVPLPLPPPAPPRPPEAAPTRAEPARQEAAKEPPPVRQAEPTAQAASSPSPPHRMAAATPAPPHAQPAPQFNLGGVASDTNALVTGDLMVPPSADPKFHNPKPNYPDEAARRGEEGAVILMVHVSPDGLVSSVAVSESSGFRVLDQAARDAVLKWHFMPAVKQGRPVPYTMPLRIVFSLF